MATFKKYDIGESFTVEINLATYLPETHLSKQIEKIVSELDITAIESQYSSIGQNAYHPMMLLCIIFYGYTIGIRSGRKLSTACKEHIDFLYLSKGHHPSKSVLNDFRKANYQHFENLFLQVLQKCIALNLVDTDLSIVDGSKIGANSSKRATKTAEQYEKWKTHLQEDIASLDKELKELSTHSQSTDNSSQDSQDQIALKKKLRKQQSLCTKIDTAITQLGKQEADAKLNLTDEDSIIMKGKKGNFDTFYNTQAACTENQIITYCDVVLDGNDKNQLVPALKGVAKNTGKKVSQVLADADYGTFDSFEYMDLNKIEGYVPYRDMNTTYPDKTFHRFNFTYDKQKDEYICPNKQTLSLYSSRTDKQRQQEFNRYRTDACKTCPFQKQCCKPGTARRVIEREVRQDLKDKMKQRLNSPQGQKIYQKRLHPIEALFGQLKSNLGYTHFLLRGLEKVKAEFTLMCLTHNLRKMIGLLWAILSFLWQPRVKMVRFFRKFYFPRYVNELNLNTLDILTI